MNKASPALAFIVFSLSCLGHAEAGTKNNLPKNMRIYAVECAEVVDPVRALLEKRGFIVVEEDINDGGDIGIDLRRKVKATKWTSRGRVDLSQGPGQCTVVVLLEEKHPIVGWKNISWSEKKFYAPLDEQFPRVE